MKIYVACLASYNAGILHGEWIDMDGMDADDLRDRIADMLRRSPCPNVEVDCPECEGSGLGSWAASAVSDERRPCVVCEGRGTVPSAEEWAVHDYDDFPDLGEYPSVERLVEVAEAISMHGGAMHVWVARTGTVEGFEDAYRGYAADSWEDFVEQWLEDSGALDEVPEYLRRYIDFAAVARDLEAEGWWAERDTDGQLHFFSE